MIEALGAKTSVFNAARLMGTLVTPLTPDYKTTLPLLSCAYSGVELLHQRGNVFNLLTLVTANPAE